MMGWSSFFLSGLTESDADREPAHVCADMPTEWCDVDDWYGQGPRWHVNVSGLGDDVDSKLE